MIAVNNLHSVLSEKTSVLHKIAERSGFNKVLFEGKATRDLYGKYLLHKYHVYSEMESIMDGFGNNDLLSGFQFPELKRKQALAEDLKKFPGNGRHKEDILSSVSSYIYRINKIAGETPGLLIAHAYVNYFADLSGGFIIRKILKEQYNYADNELNAYDFNQIKNVDEFKKNYLSLMNDLVEELRIEEEFIEETKLAYIFNISALLELVS
jgi:heme oxygenase (biliverdin-producing, ferredoxin)